MKVELIEFPNDKLRLVFLGGGTYMIYNTATKNYVECGNWPAALSRSICRNRERCLKGFFIRRGKLKFIEE